MKVRYVREASGASQTTESFKYKSKECDISQADSQKPLVLINEPYNKHFHRITPPEKKVVDRTYSSVRTSNYVKRSSVAPEKRSPKKQLKIPSCSGNVIEEKLDDEQGQGGSQSQKRRRSITFFELSCPNSNDERGLFNEYEEGEVQAAQQMRVIIVGQFEEREMYVDISQIPHSWPLEQVALLLNNLYKQQFNGHFRNPTISVLIGRIQTKKLNKQMAKSELVRMALEKRLRESLIILEES